MRRRRTAAAAAAARCRPFEEHAATRRLERIPPLARRLAPQIPLGRRHRIGRASAAKIVAGAAAIANEEAGALARGANSGLRPAEKLGPTRLLRLLPPRARRRAPLVRRRRRHRIAAAAVESHLLPLALGLPRGDAPLELGPARLVGLLPRFLQLRALLGAEDLGQQGFFVARLLHKIPLDLRAECGSVLTSLATRISQLEQQLAAQGKRTSNITTEKSRHSKNVASLEKQLDAARSRNRELEKKVHSLEADLKLAQTERLQLEAARAQGRVFGARS